MISRSQMRRQLRANGGIMNARQGYGIGSWVKEKIRKLIPNELAGLAVKAAPFVSMIPGYGPAAAGIMRGVGKFDQTGSIGDSLKQGVGTYAGGKIFDAGMQGAGLRDAGASGYKEFLNQGTKDKIGGFFQGTKSTPATEKYIPSPGDNVMGGLPETPTLNKPTNFKDVFQNKVSEFSSGLFEGVPLLGELPPLVQQQILVGGVTSAATYIYEAFIMEEPPQDENETMEEYLARRKENVGKKMRTYMDNYMAFDAEYSALDDAGKNAVVERYNKNMGGLMRRNYQTGGITMTNSLQQNIAQNKANQRARAKELEIARSRIPGYVAAEIVSAPRPVGGGGSGITTLPDGTPYNPGRPSAPLLESGQGENPRPINPGPSKPQTLPDGTPYDPGFPAPDKIKSPGLPRPIGGGGSGITTLPDGTPYSPGRPLPSPSPGRPIGGGSMYEGPMKTQDEFGANALFKSQQAFDDAYKNYQQRYKENQDSKDGRFLQDADGNPLEENKTIRIPMPMPMDPRGPTPEMLEAMEDGTFEEKFMGPPDNNDQSGGQQSTILPGSEDIMSGFEKFYKENYGMGTPSTADVRTYKLPNGEIVQGSSTSMGQTNAYLKSIGQPPATDVNSSSAGLLGFNKTQVDQMIQLIGVHLNKKQQSKKNMELLQMEELLIQGTVEECILIY